MAEVLVLCYHGVSHSWPAATTVTPAHFEEQLTTLVRKGWRGETLVDALTAPSTDRALVVTFDDAHRSVLEHAFPVMDRLGVPGTVFVPTDYAGTDSPMGWDGYDIWMGTEHQDELLCLGWDDLRRLADRGWEIGSHTCSHPHLTQIDDEQLALELTRSRQICEREMGRRCHSIAYPYSYFDDRVLRATRDAGYELGVTVPVRSAKPLPLAWPRVGVYQGEDAKRVVMRSWRRRHSGLDAAMAGAFGAARSIKGLAKR